MAEVLQSLFIVANAVIFIDYIAMPVGMYRVFRMVKDRVRERGVTVPQRLSVAFAPFVWDFVGFVGSCGVGHALMAYTSSGFHPEGATPGLWALTVSHLLTAVVSTRASVRLWTRGPLMARAAFDSVVGRAGMMTGDERHIADTVHDAGGWLYRMNVVTGELHWSWGGCQLFGMDRPDRYAWYQVDYAQDWMPWVVDPAELAKAQAVLAHAAATSTHYAHSIRYKDPADPEAEVWTGASWGRQDGDVNRGFGVRLTEGMKIGDDKFAEVMTYLKNAAKGSDS